MKILQSKPIWDLWHLSSTASRAQRACRSLTQWTLRSEQKKGWRSVGSDITLTSSSRKPINTALPVTPKAWKPKQIHEKPPGYNFQSHLVVHHKYFQLFCYFWKMFKLARLDWCVVFWNFPQSFCFCMCVMPTNKYSFMGPMFYDCFDQYLFNLTSSIMPCKYVPILYWVDLLVYFICIFLFGIIYLDFFNKDCCVFVHVFGHWEFFIFFLTHIQKHTKKHPENCYIVKYLFHIYIIHIYAYRFTMKEKK